MQIAEQEERISVMVKDNKVTEVKKLEEKNFAFKVRVFVDYCKNIDKSFNEANPGRRRKYYVLAWMEPEYTCRSNPASCKGNMPSWKASCEFRIDQPFTIKQFLKVEVIRVYTPIISVGTSSTGCEIETSDHEVVVGRARVPLPNDCYSKKVWVNLVKFTESGCRFEGEICLGLQLIKMPRLHIW
ncbi:hypothetical protein FRX31_024335 [Thalictrum thalictroides]|uniref:C2 domain-containing protein n=1 Tax=Thalictrum thalictroides TaxID=46969 RepID=A0A7J6VMU3_THATH|nr:hypothetical protein FRX31_024335 [Thalictrum thalictroides]